jgi:cell wall-associated NlpC family hydrolase
MPDAARLDLRLNAYRADLAEARLKGRVDAARYAEGEPGRIDVAAAALRREPRPDAMRMTEALFGEPVSVFERARGWAWVRIESDGYVGYLEEGALGRRRARPTHRVAVPRTLLYPEADLKSEPARPLFLNGLVEVVEEGPTWSLLKGGGAVFAPHLAPIGRHASDAAGVAERFLDVPYLWGGKTQAGLDCSGLVQLALNAAGLACPRDTDMMEASLGEPLPDDAALRRGDLVFWRGHVGMVLDGERLLHANGFHMLTVIGPLAAAVARIAAQHGPVTSRKRVT